MDGPLESLDNLLSMEVWNSLVSLKFGVLVCPMFPILPLQIQKNGGVGLVQIAREPVTLPLPTRLDPLISVLLTLGWFLFAPVLYRVVNVINSCITGVLSACGVSISSVLMVIYGWLYAQLFGSIGITNTGTSSYLIPIIRLLNNFCEKFRLSRPQIGLVRHSRLLRLNRFQRPLLSSLRLCWLYFLWRCSLSNL